MTSTEDRLRAATTDAGDDIELLRRIAAADPAAFESLYDRFSSMAFAVAVRITADAGLAEDVVHDSFLAAWRNAARFDASRGSLKTWLLSIVHHRAIDEIRRRRPVEALPESEGPVPPAMRLPDLWPEVAGRLDAALIRQALGGLSAVQREAIELAFYGGLTQEEIAERTATPLGTVKGRMRLGLAALRRTLAGQVGEPATPPRTVAGGEGAAR